jgi:acid phosphatase type 7
MDCGLTIIVGTQTEHINYGMMNYSFSPKYFFKGAAGGLIIFFILALVNTLTHNQLNQVMADGSQSFTASEDAFVKSSTPSTNFGTAPDLEVQNDSRVMHSLIRFTVVGLPSGAAVTNTVLKLYVPSNGSVTGGDIWQVNGPWAGSTVTWSTAPAIGPKLGNMPNPVKSGVWSQATIPAGYVTGNGTYDFYLTTTNTSDAVYYASNNTTTPPTLSLTWTSGTVTPTPTVMPLTPTPTLNPTPTPTQNPTPTPPPIQTSTPTPIVTVVPTITPTPTTVPTNTPSPTPTISPTPTPAGTDPVVMAAGDIICDSLTTTTSGCRQMDVSQVFVKQNPAAALILGDLCHTPSANCFNNYYAPSYGRFKSISYPTTGNHEYLVPGAIYYFDYWNGVGNQTGQAGDRAKGYYSFDIGTWHLIALNSQCSDAGGCNAGSAQYTWLQNDLATHTNKCTLAYYHIPVFSSGGRANNNALQMFTLLYNNNVDVVLDGHDHIYERFAPQNPSGQADAVRGIREFIVGTGGANHTSIASIAANSEIRNVDTFGALKLTLHPTGYDWQFVPAANTGTFTDSGSNTCH